jgi:hypothetical protein
MKNYNVTLEFAVPVAVLNTRKYSLVRDTNLYHGVPIRELETEWRIVYSTDAIQERSSGQTVNTELENSFFW